MDRRFFVNWLVMFIAWFLGSFLVHGLLLHADYLKLTPALFRPEAEAQPYFMLMLLAHVFLSGAITWIYSRGAEAKAWVPQGVRFGIAIAFLTTIPTYMIYFVVQPTPADLAIKQIVFDSALMVLLGIVVAFLYRAKPVAAAA